MPSTDSKTPGSDTKRSPLFDRTDKVALGVGFAFLALNVWCAVTFGPSWVTMLNAFAAGMLLQCLVDAFLNAKKDRHFHELLDTSIENSHRLMKILDDISKEGSATVIHFDPNPTPPKPQVH